MKTVLFVCSGNTCRSPMAQAVFNDMAEKNGVQARAFSAGLFTENGLPYSENSVQALAEQGISLSGSSQQMTLEKLQNADFVFGLTDSLSQALVTMFSECTEKIYRFPMEVPDPFGGDLSVYQKSLATITAGIEKILAFLNGKGV